MTLSTQGSQSHSRRPGELTDHLQKNSIVAKMDSAGKNNPITASKTQYRPQTKQYRKSPYPLDSLHQEEDENPMHQRSTMVSFTNGDLAALSRRKPSGVNAGADFNQKRSNNRLETLPTRAHHPQDSPHEDEKNDKDTDSILSDIPTGLRAQREILSSLQKENFSLKLSLHSQRKKESRQNAQLEQTSTALLDAKSKTEKMEGRLKVLQTEIVQRHRELEKLISGQLGDEGNEADAVDRGKNESMQRCEAERNKTQQTGEGRREIQRSRTTVFDAAKEDRRDDSSSIDTEENDTHVEDSLGIQITSIPTRRHHIEQEATYEINSTRTTTKLISEPSWLSSHPQDHRIRRSNPRQQYTRPVDDPYTSSIEVGEASSTLPARAPFIASPDKDITAASATKQEPHEKDTTRGSIWRTAKLDIWKQSYRKAFHGCCFCSCFSGDSDAETTAEIQVVNLPILDSRLEADYDARFKDLLTGSGRPSERRYGVRWFAWTRRLICCHVDARQND